MYCEFRIDKNMVALIKLNDNVIAKNNSCKAMRYSSF